MARRRLSFYYWGSACPLNGAMRNLLQHYENDLDITLIDITHDRETARRERIFFPTLTVVDESQRLFTPLSSTTLDRLATGEQVIETPYRPALGTEPIIGDIVPITAATITAAAACTGNSHLCADFCTDKFRLLKPDNESIVGFLNIVDGQVRGGAEFTSSMNVPYDIPCNERTAFLTCSYLADSRGDAKAAPLRALEDYLSTRFDRLLAITDEVGVFPNGTLSWFLDQGFVDRGVVSVEPDYCRLHLVAKELHSH